MIKRWWRFRDIHGAFGLKFWAFVTGGGALPGAVEQFWNGLGFVLVQGYGMTETAALITLNHPFRVARGTMGKPLPGREVKLQSDGEVLVRGPMPFLRLQSRWLTAMFSTMSLPPWYSGRMWSSW